VAAGIRVTLLALESDKPLPEEASAAREAWLNAGGVIHAPDIVWPEDVDLIIDGLLGTGLRSAPRENVAALIEHANRHSAPVVALDIPSGLIANRRDAGAVIQAAHTVTFIALKPGLLTGKARDVVGVCTTMRWGWRAGWPGRKRTSRVLMRRSLQRGSRRADQRPIRAITAGW
jgi:NAD(P)H-hydrate epimerase